MNKYISLLIVFLTIFSSCSKIYDPKTDAGQNAIVVEGLITDLPGPCTVKLSMALPYSVNNDKYPPISDAKVTILDNSGNTFNLSESLTTPGAYVSDSSVFIGQAGKSYTLHIETTDGNIFESSPQQILPANFVDTTYADYASKKVLNPDYGYNDTYIQQGVNLLVDIKNSFDPLPRFRFQATVTTEYAYIISMVLTTTSFYYWTSTDPNNLVNITEDPYQTSSKDIQGHILCFIPTISTIAVDIKNEIVKASVFNRVISLKRYRLNQETFHFYSNINSLLSAQGKIFDPVAFQLKGNITCKNNPTKTAFGYFEASSLTTSFYSIKPGKIDVNKISGFNPPSYSDSITIFNGVESPYIPLPDFLIY